MTNSICCEAGLNRLLLLKQLLLTATVLAPMVAAAGSVAPGGMMGAPCSLAWGASPSGGIVAGYAIYYGTDSSSLTNRIDVGTALTVTVGNLWVGTNYFFYAVAYDGDGNESIPSQVIQYNPPPVSNPVLNVLANGTTHISVRSAPGATCQVEFTDSLNFPQWQILGSAVADTNGQVNFVDMLHGLPPTRFYRAARLP
jgi:hypothetical protein